MMPQNTWAQRFGIFSTHDQILMVFYLILEQLIIILNLHRTDNELHSMNECYMQLARAVSEFRTAKCSLAFKYNKQID